jgi:PAS domain S-box-containing protein
MIDALPAAIYTTDATGRITHFNPACVQFSGRTPELGSDHWCVTWKLFYPDGRPMPHDECPMAIALKERRIVRGTEAIAERPDGSRIWFEAYPTPLFDESGNLVGGINMLVDITDRKLAEQALRESEQRYRHTLSLMPAAVYSCDASGVITYYNERAAQLWGRSPQIGDTEERSFGMDQMTLPDGTPLPHEKCPMAIALREGRVFRDAEMNIRRPDGSMVQVMANIDPIRNERGEVIGAISAFHDVSMIKQAEQAKARLAAIVESSDDAIISKGLDGIITSWNTSAERLFGYTAQEAIGQSITMLIPADRRDEVPKIIERLKRGERVDHFETKRVRKDGTLLDISLTISPLKESSGRIIGASKVARDITERKRAEQALRESEERFRMLADNMAQLAWTCDKLGNATWYNRRWLEYTGQTFDDMRDWGWTKCHHPDHVDRVVASVTRSRETGEVWEDTFPLRGKDGQYRWFLSRAVPIRDTDGSILRWFGTNTDVTDQLAAEEALREADRRKNEFLAMLAHELRNPLAPIRNAVQILRLAGGDEPIRSVCDTMERQVNQLVRMVDDLLDVNRISRGKIELRIGRTELAPIVHHAVESVRPIIENKGHDLSVTMPSHPVYLDADPARMAQVLGNLLNNACKFTPNGGRITLDAEQQADHVVIRVRDNGIGIAGDQLARIFEMFTQVDTSLERSVSGLGIGLTLVKKLVEMHNGTVEAHSDGIAQGSEFVVRLPISIAAPDPHTAVPLVSETVTTIPRRILVVDDNRDSAKTLAMLLKLTGHQTHIAFDGLEAIAAAESIRPDVVLLDIGLPKLNGYEAAITIREQPWGKDMRLVAVTGWGQDDDRQKSKDAGFDAHVVKPIEHAVLTKLLAELMPHPA